MDAALDCISTIDGIEAEDDFDKILGIFSNYVGRYGFTSVAICQLTNPASISDTKSQIVLTNWPDEWRSQWWESGYMQHDPIIHYLLRSRVAFRWSTAYLHASKYGRKILDEAKAFGLNDGIAFPVTTGEGPIGCVSLGAERFDLTQKEQAAVELVSIHCYMHIVQCRDDEAKYCIGQLSKRETEVMHFIAAGKTNWEIAKILDLSENSVKEYFRNAAGKLNAVNRAQAVSSAIRHGLIIN